MVVKFDLMRLYKCYRHENTSKESKEYIFEIFSCVQPLPTDSGHQSDRKNHENNQKIKKIAIFQKSIFCFIVAGNRPSGPRKAPRKPILTILHDMAIFWKKSKKSHFYLQNQHKKNFRPNILADVARPTNQYRGSIHPIPSPKLL